MITAPPTPPHHHLILGMSVYAGGPDAQWIPRPFGSKSLPRPRPVTDNDSTAMDAEQGDDTDIISRVVHNGSEYPGGGKTASYIAQLHANRPIRPLKSPSPVRPGIVSSNDQYGGVKSPSLVRVDTHYAGGGKTKYYIARPSQSPPVKRPNSPSPDAPDFIDPYGDLRRGVRQKPNTYAEIDSEFSGVSDDEFEADHEIEDDANDSGFDVGEDTMSRSAKPTARKTVTSKQPLSDVDFSDDDASNYEVSDEEMSDEEISDEEDTGSYLPLIQSIERDEDVSDDDVSSNVEQSSLLNELEENDDAAVDFYAAFADSSKSLVEFGENDDPMADLSAAYTDSSKSLVEVDEVEGDDLVDSYAPPSNQDDYEEDNDSDHSYALPKKVAKRKVAKSKVANSEVGKSKSKAKPAKAKSPKVKVPQAEYSGPVTESAYDSGRENSPDYADADTTPLIPADRTNKDPRPYEISPNHLRSTLGDLPSENHCWKGLPRGKWTEEEHQVMFESMVYFQTHIDKDANGKIRTRDVKMYKMVVKYMRIHHKKAKRSHSSAKNYWLRDGRIKSLWNEKTGKHDPTVEATSVQTKKAAHQKKK